VAGNLATQQLVQLLQLSAQQRSLGPADGELAQQNQVVARQSSEQRFVHHSASQRAKMQLPDQSRSILHHTGWLSVAAHQISRANAGQGCFQVVRATL
jgi:hypothetical protein